MANMPEQKMIPCPECAKYGLHFPCGNCDGSGSLEDRRAPTAAERAVERIKEQATYTRSAPRGLLDENYNAGAVHFAEWCMAIINEEAGRDQ